VRVKPQIGDVVKSTVPTETIAGYVVGVEGIWLWVRYFDTAAEGESWDVYTRRDNVKVVSRGRN
jgi:hypothetical protein